MNDHPVTQYITQFASRLGTVAALLTLTMRLQAATPATQPEQTRPAVLNPKPMLLERARQIEDEIATLMQRRSDAGQSSPPTIDVQIDLRVMAAWLLHRSAAGDPGSDLAAAGSLRARELLSASAAADRALASPAFNSTQLDALGRLHQMTFKLANPASVALMDQMCHEVGELLLTACGPLPARMSELPAMRPAPTDLSTAYSPHGPRTLAELTAAVGRAAVSAGLRRELRSLVTETTRAADDRNRQAEAAVLSEGLARAVDVADSLQQSGVVAPAARDQIESQLTNAVTLFVDVRTRDAGKARLESLDDYRRLLTRVRAMHLSQDVRERLVPAFTWARRHSETGSDVMGAIEEYSKLCASHDTHERPPIAASEKKAIEALEKQFADQRRAFLADAAGLNDDAADPEQAVRQLQDRLAQLGRTSDSLDLIEQIPAELQALAPYKPRPSGGLEHRAMVAANALSGIAQNPDPQTARDFLAALRSMARAARELAQPAVPAEIDDLYARGHLAQFNKCRSGLLTLLSSEAAGREIDRAKLSQLEASQTLAEALREAARTEGVCKQQTVLRRWVDWDVSANALSIVLQPYRDATADAIEAITRNERQALEVWQPARARIRPLLVLIGQVGSHIPACNHLPTGWTGEIAKLLTPMDNQPFEAERYASLVLGTFDATNADAASMDPKPILEALNARIGSETQN